MQCQVVSQQVSGSCNNLQDDALQVETPAVIKPSGAAGGLRGCDGDKP